jgi:PhoH-like ATPase
MLQPSTPRTFLQRHGVEIEDQSYVAALRAGRGEIFPFPAELAQSAYHINDPIVFDPDSKAPTLARVRKYDEKGNLGLSYVSKPRKEMGVEPIGLEQIFAWELMMDNSVQCVVLYGIPGSGKTFLATTCAGSLVDDGYFHEGVKLLKPNVSLGKSLGSLPGTLKEKMEAMMRSMTQHLNKVFKHKEAVTEKIQEEAVEYQRGVSHENSIVIIDEAQNLTAHEAYTLITRLHHSSRVFLCGDLTQVDSRGIMVDNGLAVILKHLRRPEDQNIAFVEFFKSERKGVSLLAYQRLFPVIAEMQAKQIRQ